MSPPRRWAPTALAALVALVLAGCGSSKPASGTAGFVPAGALAAVHVSTDPDRAETTRLLAVLRRFPSFGGLQGRLESSIRKVGPGPATGVSFTRDIRPWLGKEAGLALLPGSGTTAGTLIVLSVKDERGARGFLARLGAPTSREDRRGVRIDRHGQQATAFDDGMLLLGDLDSVRTAIDAHAEKDGSLADSAAYQDALDGAPDDRGADVYASPDGLRRLLGGQGVSLGPFAPLAEGGSVRGVGMALSAGSSHTATLWVHLARRGGRDGEPTVSSSAAKDVPAPVIGALSVAGGDRTVRAAALGRGLLAGPLRSIEAALAASRVDVNRDLAPLLKQPFTAALLPRPGDSPALLLLGRTDDPKAARVALARLQAPLVSLLGPLAGAEGAAPTVTDTTVDGTQVFRIEVSPSLEVDYALWDDRFAIGTDLRAVAAARRDGRRLSDDPRYRSVAGSQEKGGTSLGFLDFGRLLALAEASGLSGDATYRAARSDLRRIDAIGLRSTSGEGQSTAEITLHIP